MNPSANFNLGIDRAGKRSSIGGQRKQNNNYSKYYHIKAQGQPVEYSASPQHTVRVGYSTWSR